jgi:hypothetical protein
MSGFPESAEEKRQRYIRLAGEAARVSAGDKRIDIRESGLEMAQSWLALASAADADGSAAEPEDSEAPVAEEAGASGGATAPTAPAQ